MPEAHAGDPGQELRDVERAMEAGRSRQQTLEKKAAELAKNVRNIRKEMIATARRAQEREESVSAHEGRLKTLEGQLVEKRQALWQQQRRFGEVTAALERLAIVPKETLLVLPLRPIDTVRSINLIRFTVPRIESKAAELRRELTVFASLKAEIVRRQGDLAEGKNALEKERDRLGQLLTQKQSLEAKTRTESKAEQARLAALAGQAKDLRELLARLERAPRSLALAPFPKSGVPSFRQTAGTLPLPARGRIARLYDEPTEFGMPSKGITVETRPHAQVIAPFDGQVVFAGPFRGYGPLLIIRHSEGYHTLLAGLFRIDAAVGQWVLAGEPVGAMGNPDGGKPSLYIELRHEGHSINPLPWLAAGKGKVSG